MKEFKDLSPEEQQAYQKALEDEIKPLEERGIVKKVKIKGKKYYQTPVDLMKLEEAIRLALKEKNGDPKSILVDGQKVLLSLAALMPLFYLVNQEGTEEAWKLNQYIDEIQNKESLSRVENQFTPSQIGSLEFSFRELGNKESESIYAEVPINDHMNFSSESEAKAWTEQIIDKVSAKPQFVLQKQFFSFSKKRLQNPNLTQWFMLICLLFSTFQIILLSS